MNLPNKITLTRIFMIPVFVLFFYLDVMDGWNYLIAAIIFVLAAATDALDGHIARSRNLVTNLGKFLDPIADKVLVATAFILLLTRMEVFYAPFYIFNGGSVAAVLDASYAMTVVAGICVALIMARELIVSGFRMVAAERKLVIAADKLGKVKTTCQDAAIAFLLVGLSFSGSTAGQAIGFIGIVLFFACTVLTVLSGVNYIVKNRQVLTEEKGETQAHSDGSAADTVSKAANSAGGVDGAVEPYYIKVLAAVIKYDVVSLSMIQRKCDIGYIKACRAVEWLEKSGYISPFDENAKTRTILFTKEDFEAKYGDIDKYGEQNE